MSCSARLGLFCLLGAVAASTGGDLSAPVAVLTDGNFEDALLDTEKRVWMIEFYAPVRLPACAVPCRSVPRHAAPFAAGSGFAPSSAFPRRPLPHLRAAPSHRCLPAPTQWCAHCKALAPKYEEAATKVTSLRFAKVDATAHKLYASKFKVTG